ncbi:MAG: hypothetical protein GX282_03755 [Campylobacteraceae bacterium]|nr:hypothetical protein [Campylobacteraceae bacterium]
MDDRKAQTDKLREILRVRKPRVSSNNESSNFENLNSSNSQNGVKSVNLKDNANLEKENLQDGLNLNNTLNLESSNLDNSSNLQNQTSTQISDNKNSNKRDYDKEPIIIKSYEIFFVACLHFMSIWLSIFTAIVVDEFLFVENPSFHIVIFFICFHIVFMGIWSSYIFYRDIIKNNHQIYFTQNFISFYENGELKSNVDNTSIKRLIAKPLWTYYFIRTGSIWNKIFYILLLSLLFIISFKFCAMVILFMYIYMMIFKLTTHILFSKNLKDFRFFNTICVDEPIIPRGYITDGRILSQRYYLIYYFNEKTHQEIKTYFLDRKNIDIDKVRKDYFILY